MGPKHRVAVHWLRRDLRLADNPALDFACAHAQAVVLVYIHAPDEEVPFAPGAASRWWLHHSLQSLAVDLRRQGQTLHIRSGGSLETLLSILQETEATLVTWNRLYEPAVIARDAKIKTDLRERGIEVQSYNSHLLFEPWELQTQSAQPYKVFTPFARAAAARVGTLPPPQPRTKSIPRGATIRSEPLESLRLLPTIPWDKEFVEHWQPGEAGAHERLRRFIEGACPHYATARDFPSRAGTSRLAAHLHFGELGPRQILAALHGERDAQGTAGRETFVRELIWREFAHHVLFHFPHTVERNFDAKFDDFRWSGGGGDLFAWQRGRTGFPIVDAGLRELWRTGSMHNRVRMLAASLLTKNLNVHWRHGASWFWDTLVDADLANNTLGWQWTAGCGTDAAPYFRIFNPQLQGERFDAEGDYVRRWVPELARLPAKWIHRPDRAPPQLLADAGIVLGRDYPLPIVDLQTSREAALAAFKATRS